MKPVMNQESHLLTTSGLVLGPKGPLVVALISVSVKSVFNTHRRTYLNTYYGSLDVCNIISPEYFQFCKAHFLCNTIMPLFTNILNFQNDVYHFVTLLYKMTSHFAKMIIPGYFKTFYVAAEMEAEQSFIR